MQKRTYFNLVEIILALGIILIGVVSLMGLFPAAAKVTNDAAMETYGANALEELAAFIADSATRDVEAANIKDAGWDKWIKGDDLIPADEPKAMFGDAEEHEAEILDKSKWTTLDRSTTGTDGMNRCLFKHSSQAGVFLLVSVRGKKLTETVDLDDDADAIDSRVLITVWKSPLEKQFNAGVAPEEDSSYNYGVRLNLKAGWPAERPEARQVEVDGETVDGEKEKVWVPLRQIKVMTFDLHKPVQRKQ